MPCLLHNIKTDPLIISFLECLRKYFFDLIKYFGAVFMLNASQTVVSSMGQFID